MSNGAIFIVAAAVFAILMVADRAFSAKARARETDMEAGCLIVGLLVVMTLFGLAVDHLSVALR